MSLVAKTTPVPWPTAKCRWSAMCAGLAQLKQRAKDTTASVATQIGILDGQLARSLGAVPTNKGHALAPGTEASTCTSKPTTVTLPSSSG